MSIHLSLIIPTRNRSEYLKKTLESIRMQTLDQQLFEVIICDNNSSDSTKEVAAMFHEAFLNFQYKKTFKPGLHVGRNMGFKLARGEVLVYTDDDIEASPNWLSAIHKTFWDKTIMLTGGKIIPKWEVEPPEWVKKLWVPDIDGNKIVGHYSILDLGVKTKEVNPHYIWGCNFSVRKSVIQQTQGFNPDGMPDELIEYRGDGETAVSEYLVQNGYNAIYNPEISVYHFIPKSRLCIDYIKNRNFRQGISNSYTHWRMGNTNQNLTLNQTIKKILKNIFWNMGRSGHKEKNDFNLSKLIIDSHNAGYAFHRKRLQINQDLKEWVMKKNYLDEE